MFLVSSCSCLCPIHWSQMLSWEWRCSWSSADRRCTNYIWVINNFIAYWGAPYIRDFTVIICDLKGLTATDIMCEDHFYCTRQIFNNFGSMYLFSFTLNYTFFKYMHNIVIRIFSNCLKLIENSWHTYASLNKALIGSDNCLGTNFM